MMTTMLDTVFVVTVFTKFDKGKTIQKDMMKELSATRQKVKWCYDQTGYNEVIGSQIFPHFCTHQRTLID